MSDSVSYQTYWRHPFEEDLRDISDAPSVEDIREIFIDAVRLHLRSDVPVGILLSGDDDSSSIVGAAKRISALDGLRVLPVVSDDVQSNEEPFIDLMGDYAHCPVLEFRGDHNPVGLLDGLGEACSFNDELVRGSTSIAYRNLMRMAISQNITVLLTGQDSHEQLGGYNEFRLREAKRYIPSLLRRTGIKVLGKSLRATELLDASLGETYQCQEWRDIRTFINPHVTSLRR